VCPRIRLKQNITLPKATESTPRSKQRGRFFLKKLYKLRARAEQSIGKLKRYERVASRCEKTEISYSAIVSFACGLMLVKSVHTT
jgi:transposase